MTTDNRPVFFIKKNSTLPLLKYPLTDFLMEKYSISEDMLQDCAVTFSMYDIENDVYSIANKSALLLISTDRQEHPDQEKYTLAYKFSLHDTSKAGNFEGEFKVDFLGDHCGKMTFPTAEKISISIQSSITKTRLI